MSACISAGRWNAGTAPSSVPWHGASYDMASGKATGRSGPQGRAADVPVDRASKTATSTMSGESEMAARVQPDQPSSLPLRPARGHRACRKEAYRSSGPRSTSRPSPTGSRRSRRSARCRCCASATPPAIGRASSNPRSSSNIWRRPSPRRCIRPIRSNGRGIAAGSSSARSCSTPSGRFYSATDEAGFET